MTWRRFAVYARGLSPNSATIARVRSQQYIGGQKAVAPISSPKAAQRAFEALFATKRKKK